jgi:hypothetical protein
MSALRLVTNDPKVYIEFTAVRFPTHAFATCSVCGCLMDEFGPGQTTAEVIRLSGFHLITKHGKGEWA